MSPLLDIQHEPHQLGTVSACKPEPATARLVRSARVPRLNWDDLRVPAGKVEHDSRQLGRGILVPVHIGC
ncbi:unnamed protein product [Protopolystoma xenopodis]|uniref:Uncharacterized protein n=1 Tax=Protopolystoma xenopodis TaxID=117903 RepID=A0A3S5C8G2_9PLAT|nr:unnamed protein product [Protopolystoma xenopodis]